MTDTIPPCPVCGTVPIVQDDMYYIIRRECQLHVYQTDIQQPMVLNGMQWRSLCYQHIGKHVSKTYNANTLMKVGELFDKSNAYRRLKEGEIIQEGDQIYNDRGYFWEYSTNCFGEPAPYPQYTSHRQYRRLDERLAPDPRVAVWTELAEYIESCIGPDPDEMSFVCNPFDSAETRGIETGKKMVRNYILGLIAAQRGEDV